MNIKLAGALTGVFKGLESLYDERKNETEKTLAIRTDNAYKNYLKYQEQTLQLKEEVKKRDAEAIGFQNDLTEQERVAVASNPFILETYKKNAGKINPVTNQQYQLRDFIGKYAPGATPAGTFQDWVGTIGKPQVVEGQQPAGIGLKDDQRLFGWTADKQQQQLDKFGKAYGMTAEQIGQFTDQMQSPSVMPIAELNKEAIKAPVTREDMANSLFQRYQATKPGSPERENVEIDMAKHKMAMERFDAISGNVDYAKQLSEDRNKAVMINNDPSKYSSEEVKWAKQWLNNDNERIAATQEAQRRASMEAQGGALTDKDLSSYLSKAITAEVKQIEGELAGVKTYNGKRFGQGAEEEIQKARDAAIKRLLIATDKINEDGSLNVSDRIYQELKIQGADLVKGEDGKVRFNEPAKKSKLDIAREQGVDAVVSLINEARAAGATEEQLKTKFTKEELDASVKKTTTTEPEATTFEQRRQQMIAKNQAEQKARAEAEAKAREEERQKLLQSRPDLKGLMNRPFMQ